MAVRVQPDRRPLRPRETSALAVAPVTVTDRTCAAVLGLEPRVYREWLVSSSVPHARIGRRLVARVDDVLAALAAMRVDAGEPAARVDDDGQPATADDVLRLVGMRQTA